MVVNIRKKGKDTIKKIARALFVFLTLVLVLTACWNRIYEGKEKKPKGLNYSNLVDNASQQEVRKALKGAEIAKEDIDFFFQEVNAFNATVENKSLVKHGFVTIDSLEPDYDLLLMMDLWNSKYPDFLGYNCRITNFDLMKDLISVGKIDSENTDWLVFDQSAIENNPEELFSQEEYEKFQSLNSFIPTENTQDISIHLKKVQENWQRKEIEFVGKDKSSVISVFFHDETGNLFIGHLEAYGPGPKKS